MHCLQIWIWAYKIVALQTAIEYMAKEFPGSFDGYSLSVIESHQAAKADTSGKYSGVFVCLSQEVKSLSRTKGCVFPPPFAYVDLYYL